MKTIIVICLTFVLFSCAVQDEIVKPTYPSQGIYSTPKIITQPQIPMGETPPTLTIGTKFTFRQANAITKNWSNQVWVIKDISEWQGVKCYIIDISSGAGETFILWDTNLNYMATINKDGKAISLATPLIKTYTWPLKIGSAYNTIYDYISAGKKVSSQDQVTIENMITINVPLGTYSTFILKRISNVMVEKIYYSPAVGFPIKWQWSQAIDHPQGPGEFIVELIKIEK